MLPIVLGVLVLVLLLTSLFWLTRYRKLKESLQSQIEEAHNEAQKAIKAKDTFLANISHETRTPMNAIIGLSHILLQSELNDDQKTNLFKIKRSAEHLLSITNDILDYSKLEAGKLELESIQINSNDFFSHLSDLISPMAIDKKLDLVFDISPSLPVHFEGDPLRLSQILLNLLNNAVKFTEKGSVTLYAAPAKHEGQDVIRFEVKDTGIGLKRDQLTVLFDAFSQADNSISRKFGGTGLGLSISSELAAMMGTRIEVESRYAEGSVFAFTLPTGGTDRPDEKLDRLSKRLLEEKSILIYDRETANAAILAAILRHFKARPVVAASLSDLQRLTAWERYDAVLLDSRLFSVVDVSNLKAHCEAFIVLLYALLPDNSVKQAAPNALLHKPFTPLSVQSTMTGIFGKEIAKNSVSKQHVGLEDILVLEGSRILLAEDNEGNVMVIEGLLEGSGITLHSASNGQKAVEALLKSSTPYDLLLMDINMPVMDGYAATSIIREYQKYDDMPIIAMTANITESDMKKTQSVGMQDFLGKPIDVEQFYLLLLKYISPKKKQSDVRPMKTEPSAVQTKQTSALEFPGVDTREGLSRLNGNQEAYLKILKKYAELFSDVAKQLDAAAAKGSMEEGRALAHNLKGLSGNIGAKELYRMAAEIEAAFKRGDSDLSARIHTLDKALGPLITAIKQMKRPQTEEPKTPITPAALSGMLESLRESALRKKARDIKQGCNALKSHALPKEQQAHFNLLFENAERYRYDQVVHEIDILLKGLQ